MKFHLFLLLGTMISLSAVGDYHSHHAPLQTDSESIQREMEKRFLIRDTFKEKGNSGKYLKVSHMQP